VIELFCHFLSFIGYIPQFTSNIIHTPALLVIVLLHALICVCIFTGASSSISTACPCLDYYFHIYSYTFSVNS
jgi:hypothetical protein